MERNISSTIMINPERSDLYNILRQISHNGMLVIIYQTKVQQQRIFNISQKLTEYLNTNSDNTLYGASTQASYPINNSTKIAAMAEYNHNPQ